MIPYQECSSFLECSSPKCPLDPDIDSRIRYSDEDNCKAHKTTRHKIGLKYNLPFQGLTKREFKGMNWTEAQRDKQREIFLQRELSPRKREFDYTKTR